MWLKWPAALAAYLVARLPQAQARLELLIEQGVDMGRPSRLSLAAHKAHGIVQ